MKYGPGQKSRHLTAIGPTDRFYRTARLWSFRCDCGRIMDAIPSRVFNKGTPASCGCAIVPAARTHGMYSSPEYYTWRAMRQRCENPNNKSYSNYGARGIEVCEQWRSFDGFFADMGRRPSPLHTLDRINGDLGYGPGNCRWTTREVQGRNTRSVLVNETAVCLMRHMRRRGEKLSDIGYAFGVGEGFVCDVVKERKWRGASAAIASGHTGALLGDGVVP